MGITEFAIKNNRVTAVMLLIIFVGAISTYFSMSRAEDPGFLVRTAIVTTYMPGASPARVEQLITDKLEKVIQELPELKSVQSESRTGISIITVELKPKYFDLEPIWDDLRRKINKVIPELPKGATQPSVDDELGDVFGIILSVVGDGFDYAELKEVAESVRDELLRLDEVAKVNIQGIQEERIFVEYNNATLSELGFSPQHLVQILSSRNIIDPGGSVTTGEERIILEPTGNFESIEELKKTVINAPNRSELFYLEDIAKITRGFIDPPSPKVTTTGRPSLALAISMREGGNIIRLGEDINRLIPKLESLYPIGIDFELIAFQPELVANTVNSFVSNLIQAIAIVTAVMFLTLGFRTGIVVASLIPAAILMTIMLMGSFNIGLDQVSLAALIIALGMLVDNAIVIVESILVQAREGKSLLQAAIDSAKELRVALLTSSLTTAAAFLPIYLAESETGEYTAPLFKVVTITLLSSWVLALTFIPLLGIHILRPQGSQNNNAAESYSTPFYERYREFLVYALSHRALSLAVVALLFVGAISLSKLIPNIFFPPSDRNQFFIEFEYPLGTAIAKTEAMIADVESYMASDLMVNDKRDEGIINWASFVGEGPPRYFLGATIKTQSSEYAYMLVNVTDYEQIGSLMSLVEDYVWQHFPDVTINAKRLDFGPPVTHPVAYRILGKDEKTLFGIVEQVKEKLAHVAGTKTISDNWGMRTKKLIVDINQPRARRAGVTSQDIAFSLQAGLSGVEMTQFREGEDVIPIVLRSVEADRNDINKLESLNVFAQATGESVPLKQVADINNQLIWQPAKILRKERFKAVTVSSDVVSGYTANDVNVVMLPWLEEQAASWPPGYRYEVGGEAESSGDANAAIMAKLPIAGLIILLLLVAQFNSIRKPLIILLTIPLGLIGVILGLFLAGSYFGFMTLLGIISLSGIVINNAIVLIERINLEIEEKGESPQQAIVNAAQRRLRPILLTTVTTVVGLIPLWLSGGIMWQPMAVAIIFGLLVATLLTLCVVPVLYSLVYRVKFIDFKYRS